MKRIQWAWRALRGTGGSLPLSGAQAAESPLDTVPSTRRRPRVRRPCRRQPPRPGPRVRLTLGRAFRVRSGVRVGVAGGLSGDSCARRQRSAGSSQRRGLFPENSAAPPPSERTVALNGPGGVWPCREHKCFLAPVLSYLEAPSGLGGGGGEQVGSVFPEPGAGRPGVDAPPSWSVAR